MSTLDDSDGEASDRMERLRRLLGGSELGALRRRFRARYERGEMRDAFTLTGLDSQERRALEALLGRGVRSAASMRLTRAELDAAVRRAGLAETFRAALEALDGPLVDRRALNIERDLAWRQAIGEVRDQRLSRAVADAGGLGLLKRLAGGDPKEGRRILDGAERVLGRLPARGLPLARLAAAVLGDAHALDEGRPIAALVLRACEVHNDGGLNGYVSNDGVSNGSVSKGGGSNVEGSGGGESDGEGASGGGSTGASNGGGLLGEGGDERETRRARWASVGVTVNELTAPVLVLNLRARGTAKSALTVNTAAEIGSPMHANLRALLRGEFDWEVPGGIVHVCENPSIVASAADELGPACRPLVCTDGMPGAAQQTLFRQLVASGVRLLYHGDFDWPGIGIGNFMVRKFGAHPWRFCASDYSAAPVDEGLPLSRGRRVAARWDERLAEVMEARGIAIHEEGVAELLLSDLVSS